jgi:polyferredoxin
MATKYIKKDRCYTPYRKIAWILVPLIAFGGLYYPKLGLLGILIMLTMMVMGFLKGRYWCGNLCPHGSLFDFILMRFSLYKKIPAFFKSPILRWTFFAYFMSMFLFRLTSAFGYWGEAEFVNRLGNVFVRQNLVWPTIGGTIFALTINPRAWCSFCPMGTMLKIMYRLGKVFGLNKNTDEKITINEEVRCKQCTICSRVCPVQLEPYQNWDDNQFKDDNCIKCSPCVENCPSRLLSLVKTPKIEVSANEKSLPGL